ncbi:hypothetical protein ILYODFUR_025292 [Ilyodon furcidens]|uniref:Uncharacterized protein n=1 Tax=Ilyodon furcidens TaxID=33524 RepID=A0ABV0TNG4_9TELE
MNFWMMDKWTDGLTDKCMIEGCRVAGAYLQQSTGEKQGIPWSGRQSIAKYHGDTQDKKPCPHPFIPKGNLERPINLRVMFLTVGGSQSTQRQTTHARGEHANSIQKDKELNPDSDTNCATVQTST